MNERSIANELKAEYCFVFLPFFILIITKLIKSDFLSILIAPDWSLASCIIIGQTQSRLIIATLSSKSKTDKSALMLYIAKKIILISVPFTFYFYMQDSPSYALGAMQIVLFIYASWLHFVEGRAAKLISL